MKKIMILGVLFISNISFGSTETKVSCLVVGSKDGTIVKETVRNLSKDSALLLPVSNKSYSSLDMTFKVEAYDSKLQRFSVYGPGIDATGFTTISPDAKKATMEVWTDQNVSLTCHVL